MLPLLLPLSQPYHPNNKTYRHILTYLPPPTTVPLPHPFCPSLLLHILYIETQQHLAVYLTLHYTSCESTFCIYCNKLSCFQHLYDKCHMAIFLSSPLVRSKAFLFHSLFQHLIFSTNFSSDSAISARSSTYSNAHGKPSLNSFDNDSNTMMNNSGLSTEP